MPNWNNIAEKVARGMFGQRWAQEDRQAQELQRGELEMALARSREGREAAQEGRAAEEFGQKKSMFGDERTTSANRARQSTSEADIAGTKAKDAAAAILREIETHNQGIRQSNATIRNLDADNKRADAALGIQRDAANRAARADDLNFETNAATQAARIRAVTNPADKFSKAQQNRWTQALNTLLVRMNQTDDADQQ